MPDEKKFTPLELTLEESFVVSHAFNLGLLSLESMMGTSNPDIIKASAQQLMIGLRDLGKENFQALEDKMNLYFKQYADASGGLRSCRHLSSISSPHR